MAKDSYNDLFNSPLIDYIAMNRNLIADIVANADDDRFGIRDEDGEIIFEEMDYIVDNFKEYEGASEVIEEIEEKQRSSCMDINKMKYVIEHRKAFRKVARDLGCMRFRCYFHDIDKLFMLPFMDVKTVSDKHRKHSRHHSKASTRDDYIEMVIDWECARITKPDKPLDAYGTLMLIYPHMCKEILPILEEFNLIDKGNNEDE